MRSLTNSKEDLGITRSTELHTPILPQHHPRWERLPPGVDRSVNWCERYRGALIGGAMGDAMTALAEGSPRPRRPAEPADEIARPRWPPTQRG